jgi:gamma-glutamylcyclotransferase (GGCT)/AIG2-like uncharacterized protein YtfP
MIHFAYGIDLNPAWMVRHSPGHRSLGIARLIDHGIAFPHYSSAERSAFMSIVAKPGHVVWGALYEVPEDDLPVLDHVFEFAPDGPSHLNAYIRKTVSLQRPGGMPPIEASVYIAAAHENSAPPTDKYMMAVLDGARYHGLPKAYVGALQAVRTRRG